MKTDYQKPMLKVLVLETDVVMASGNGDILFNWDEFSADGGVGA